MTISIEKINKTMLHHIQVNASNITTATNAFLLIFCRSGRRISTSDKTSTEAYKNYWVTCTDTYVFDIEERKKLSIQQLIPPSVDVNIQSFDKPLASDMLHYLVHMSEKFMKQSLCVIPVNKTRKPDRGN